MANRIYVVTPKGGEQGPRPNGKRLVDAGSQSAAIRHVVKGLFSAEAAGARDIAELMAAGVKVEDAGAEAGE